MVGSDHDLDYPPYLHREQQPPPHQPTDVTNESKPLNIAMWMVAVAAAAGVAAVLVLAS
jgi:hypothetical protein